MDNPTIKFEFFNVNYSNFSGMKNYLELYEEFGVVVFRKFFNKDPIFTDFYNDIKLLAHRVIDKHKLNIDLNNNLNKILTEISLTNREEISAIYDLGTRPLKLLSGNRMKTHPLVVEMVKTIFGRESIVASPYLGDTLHIFPPGKENFQYNLPMHQDYPYIMQSPEQITAYINLGELQEANNGGIRIWPGSHRQGISPSTKLENKLRITTNADYYRDNYSEVDISFDVGDLAIFNSLIQHEGIQNKTACTRIVQLMRYSNLANDVSTSYSWGSCEGIHKGIQFSDIHEWNLSVLIQPLGHMIQYHPILTAKEKGRKMYYIGERFYRENLPYVTEKRVQKSHFKQGFSTKIFPRIGLSFHSQEIGK